MKLTNQTESTIKWHVNA